MKTVAAALASLLLSGAPAAAADAPQGRPPVKSYLNGDFTGDTVDTHWGPVQVKVSVRGGSIAGIDCLVYPDHRRRSEEISQWAIPALAQEVIHAQNGTIDVVSGATLTSYGYQQSLGSALAKATQS